MFTAEIAPTLGALSGLFGAVLAGATWWVAQRAKRAQHDVDVIRVSQEALVETIEQQRIEIAQLRADVAEIKVHHRECEAKRAELALKVAELEAMR